MTDPDQSSPCTQLSSRNLQRIPGQQHKLHALWNVSIPQNLTKVSFQALDKCLEDVKMVDKFNGRK